MEEKDAAYSETAITYLLNGHYASAPSLLPIDT